MSQISDTAANYTYIYSRNHVREKMLFREGIDSDVPEISNLHRQAFNGPDESLIVDNLRKNKKLILSIVCEIEGKIIGHIAYSRVFYKKEPVGTNLPFIAKNTCFGYIFLI